MADPTGRGNPGREHPEGPEDSARLADLEARLARARQARSPDSGGQAGKSLGQAGQAWRMVVELVVGIAIGAGMGYGLDVLFGTSPWFLVPFTLLGFAAGVRTMLRTAEELRQEEDDTAVPPAAGDEGEGE